MNRTWRFVALTAVWYCLALPLSVRAGQSDVRKPDAEEIERAHAQIEQNKFDEALSTLKAIEARTPNLKGLAHELGLVSYKQGKYLSAARYFERALEEDPNNKVAIQLRGLSLFNLGNPGEAIPLLEKVHSWYPVANVDATYVLGLAYIQTKDYNHARKTVSEMYGVGADSAASYLFLARILLRQGYDPVAEEHALKAAEIDPKLPLVHYLLGEFYLYKAKLPEAIKQFEAEIGLNPGYAGSYDRLADAYFRSSQFDEAQRLLQRSILLDANATGPYILMGKVLLKKNDPAQALLYLQHANKMESNNFITHYLMGQSHRALNNPSAAERELKLAEQLQSAQGPLK